MRCIKCQIQHRREIYVESQSAAVFSDHLAMLLKHLGIAGRKYVGGRGRGAQRIAQAIDGSTFHVDARE
jgi:hypothetical protein